MSKRGDLTDFVSLKTLEKIQDNFSEATGISCVIRDLSGNAVTKFSKPSRLWLEVIKHPQIEQASNEHLLKVLEKSLKTDQIDIYQRYLDTYAFAVPVMVNSKIKTFFIGGLVRYGNPKMDLCQEEAKRLGLTFDAFLEMYLELPLVTKEKLLASANLLKIIAQALSNVAEEGDKRYQKLFNTINDGILIVDLEGSIQDINPAGAALLSYNREELIGKPVKTIYAQFSDREVFLEKIMQLGHVENFHIWLKVKDGTMKYFEVNATVLKNNYGQVIGTQGTFRDITHRQHQGLNSADFVKTHGHSNLQQTEIASRQNLTNHETTSPKA